MPHFQEQTGSCMKPVCIRRVRLKDFWLLLRLLITHMLTNPRSVPLYHHFWHLAAFDAVQLTMLSSFKRCPQWASGSPPSLRFPPVLDASTLVSILLFLTYTTVPLVSSPRFMPLPITSLLTNPPLMSLSGTFLDPHTQRTAWHLNLAEQNKAQTSPAYSPAPGVPCFPHSSLTKILGSTEP